MQGKLNKILLVISSMLFFAALFGWYSSAMPKFYESKTVLSIKPPTISTRVVRNLTEEDLAQKLQPMNEEILSRTSIEVMISKYGLFEKEKAQGMPIELIIDKMRKNIRVNPEKSDLGEWRNFLITYRDTTPENARNVAAELAGKYVNQEVPRAVEVSLKTREFINSAIIQVKEELDKAEKERLEIIIKKLNNSRDKSLNDYCGYWVIDGLYSQKWILLKVTETLSSRKELLSEKARLLNSQINLIEQFKKDDSEFVKEKEIVLLQIKSLSLESQNTENELHKIEKLSEKYAKELSNTEKEIFKIEKQIFNNHPNLKADLLEIDAKYQVAKSRFEELIKEANDFCKECDWETSPNEITIQIVDPANLPTSPTSFTTKDFILFGAGFGFIFSLFLLGLGSGVNYLNNRFGKTILQ